MLLSRTYAWYETKKGASPLAVFAAKSDYSEGKVEGSVNVLSRDRKEREAEEYRSSLGEN